MMRVWTWFLVMASLAVYGFSVVAVWTAPDGSDAAATAPATRGEDSAPAAKSRTLPATGMIGVGMNFYHVGDATFVLEAIDDIAEMGFTGVQIVTPVFQRDGASERVEVIEGDGRGPRRADLLAVMRRAKERGLTVSLMPQVNLTDPRGNEWRGKIEPAPGSAPGTAPAPGSEPALGGWDAWWDSYIDAIGRFADLAAEAEADVFVVGCELLTTLRPEHDAAWSRVIDTCRTRFPGALTYSTTWDTYGRVRFWDQLDLIGISGYWDLTAGAADDTPTDAELAARWREIREDLAAFAEAKGKPILVTEVGWPSLPWALRDPWNYVPDSDTPADVEAQTRGYRSFIAAWGDAFEVTKHDGRDARPAKAGPTDSAFLGVYFYEWGLYTEGGPADRGYTFRGKPAGAVVEAWLER